MARNKNPKYDEPLWHAPKAPKPEKPTEAEKPEKAKPTMPEKAKPAKPEKAKPTKPEKAKPAKPEKTRKRQPAPDGPAAEPARQTRKNAFLPPETQATPGQLPEKEKQDEKQQSGASAILAEIRARQRARRVRGTVLVVIALALVLAWLSGFLSSSVSAASDLLDTVKIAMLPADGYPAQTGVTELYQLAPLTGGFVELGEESCVLYTSEGTRLRNIQAGDARPAVAAGGTRFVLYNRGGTELRVESRTRTLYTQTMGGSILLCAMAQNGTLAAAAEDTNYLAKLTVYTTGMAEQMSWGMTETEGTPIRMAFSADSRKLAVATLSASGGQLASNLYLLDLFGKEQKLLTSVTGSAPVALEWADSSTLLVLYGDHASLLSARDGTEKARYDYGGEQLVDYSANSGSAALLLTSGTAEQLVLLDDKLAAQAAVSVVAADRVTLTRTAAYTCTQTAVECYSLKGEYQWKRDYAAAPQAVLESKQLLVFTGDLIEVCQMPAEESTNG